MSNLNRFSQARQILAFGRFVVGLLVVATLHPEAVAGESEIASSAPVVICPKSITSRPRAQLHDLYYGLLNDKTYSKDRRSYKTQLDDLRAYFKTNFNFAIALDFNRALDQTLSSLKLLDQGQDIWLPALRGLEEALVIPTGCSLRSIGYYEENGRLKVSTDSFQKLSEIDKAAFIAHEVFRRLNRDQRYVWNYKLQPSNYAVRELVAEIFSIHRSVERLKILLKPFTWHIPVDDKPRSTWSVASSAKSLFALDGEWGGPVLLTGDHEFRVVAKNLAPSADSSSGYFTDPWPHLSLYCMLSSSQPNETSWEKTVSVEMHSAELKQTVEKGCFDLVVSTKGNLGDSAEIEVYYGTTLLLTAKKKLFLTLVPYYQK